MATSRAQQVGIWIIAVVLTLGTIASFIAIVIGNDNQRNQTAQQQADQAAAAQQMQQQQEAYLATLEPLPGYSATAFDANVSQLSVEVLVQGDGVAVKATDTIKASYTGWLSDGKIFDSTKKKGSEDAPISFALNQVIKGWTNGLTDVKTGSVIKLTIPAEQGYGSAGSPPVIPANAPLQFVIKVQSIEPKK